MAFITCRWLMTNVTTPWIQSIHLHDNDCCFIKTLNVGHAHFLTDIHRPQRGYAYSLLPLNVLVFSHTLTFTELLNPKSANLSGQKFATAVHIILDSNCPFSQCSMSISCHVKPVSVKCEACVSQYIYVMKCDQLTGLTAGRVATLTITLVLKTYDEKNTCTVSK